VNPNLPELAAYWQAKLRLQDWQIEVAYVKDLASPDGSPVYGLCYPFLDNKQAKIFIRDPETSTPLATSAPSVEKIIVHELCHLHFAPLSGSSKAEVAAEEQAVWAISGAMVAARGTGDEPTIMRAMLARISAPRRRMGGQMDPKLITAALDAIEQGDSAKAIELLKGIIASAAGATPAEPGGEGPPPPEAKAPPGPPPPASDDAPPSSKKAPPPAAKPPMGAAAPPPTLPRKAAQMPASTDPVIAALAAQVQALTDKQAANDASAVAAERAQILSSRPEIAAGLRAMIADVATPIETARAIAAAVAPTVRTAKGLGTEVVGGALTQGQGQAGAVQLLPPEQAEQLHRAMGIVPEGSSKPRTNEGGQWVRPLETPTQARARLAAAPKGQA